MEEDWDDDEAMGMVAAVGMAFAIGFTVVAVTSIAIAWNALSLAAEAVQTLRRKL